MTLAQLFVLLAITLSCNSKSERQRDSEVSSSEVAGVPTTRQSSSLGLTDLLGVVKASQGAAFAKPCPDQAGFQLPTQGSLCSGNLQTRIDLNPLPLSLFHNSQNEKFSGDFGRGWSMSIERKLKTDRDGVLLVIGADGSQVEFVDVGRGNFVAKDPRLTPNRIVRTGMIYREFAIGGSTVDYAESGSALYLISQIKDLNNNVVTINRNASGQFTGLQLMNGYKIDARIDAGRVSELSYTRNNRNIGTIRFTYGGADSNFLRSIEFPDGGPATISYNEADEVISEIKAANGELTKFEYVNANTIAKIVADDGYTTVFSYSSTMAGSASPNGVVIEEYQSTSLGPMLTKFVNGSLASTFEWDAIARLTRSTDAAGSVTDFTYTGTSMFPSKIVDATGTSVELTYDNQSFGLVKSKLTKANSSQFTETYGWTGNGQIISKSVNDSITRYARDSKENLVKIETDSRVESEYGYDSQGRILFEINEFGQRTQYAYEGGLLVSVTDHLGRTNTYTRNDIGQVVTIVGPDGVKQEYAYDPSGELREATSISADTQVTVKNSRTLSFKPSGRLASLVERRMIGGVVVSQIDTTYQHENAYPTRVAFTRGSRSVDIANFATVGRYGNIAHPETVFP